MIREEIASRLIEKCSKYHVETGHPFDEIHAMNEAVLDELTRIEIRMRALAEAALDLAVPKSVQTLKAIAEGKELP